MGKFKNIPLKVFRNYLIYCGLNHIRTMGKSEAEFLAFLNKK